MAWGRHILYWPGLKFHLRKGPERDARYRGARRLDRTELNIGESIQRETIPALWFRYHQGEGIRYRSLGCSTYTRPAAKADGGQLEMLRQNGLK
jgi:hypothetical protein